MKTKAKTHRVKRPPGRALRAPLAGSPACVFAFVFVLIYVSFELIMKVIDDDDDDDFDDDDERKTSKKNNFSSNDRSGHDDQNAY